MDDFARDLLQNFARRANLSVGTGSLHPNDWQGSHEFIIHVHRRGLNISARDVSDAIWAVKGTPESTAARGSFYDEARRLLRMYGEAPRENAR